MKKTTFYAMSKMDRQLLCQKLRQKISVLIQNKHLWWYYKNSSFWYFNSSFVLKTTTKKVFVLITEIFWRNDWKSTINFVERLYWWDCILYSPQKTKWQQIGNEFTSEIKSHIFATDQKKLTHVKFEQKQTFHTW